MKRRELLEGLLALSALPLGACATPVSSAPDVVSTHPLGGLSTFAGERFVPPALHGHITILDFWASWCGPCRQAFRYLDQLYRTHEGGKLQMLAVSLDEDPQAGRGFVTRLRPRFPVAWDRDSRVRQTFNVTNLPTTLLIDAEGEIVSRHQGFDVRSHELLASHVRSLLDAL